MAKENSAVPLRLLPLKNDFVFKLVFGDKRRVDLLTAFLQAVLDLPVEEYDKITIVDPNVKKEYSKDKVGVLDVKIHTKSGTVVDVEIQVEPDAPLEKRIYPTRGQIGRFSLRSLRTLRLKQRIQPQSTQRAQRPISCRLQYVMPKTG